jgi:hypothetical protein
MLQQHRQHERHNYMSEGPTKFARRHKLLLASLATVSLSLGAASIVSAGQNPAPPTGGTAPASEEAPGVDCTDGLDATGAECDGGPAANAAVDPAEGDTGTETEADESKTEADEPESSDASEEVDGVDCENGVDAATGADCDGGPGANAQDGADDATETGSQTGI